MLGVFFVKTSIEMLREKVRSTHDSRIDTLYAASQVIYVLNSGNKT